MKKNEKTLVFALEKIERKWKKNPPES